MLVQTRHLLPDQITQRVADAFHRGARKETDVTHIPRVG
jgi:hypothetical protein